MNRVGVSEGGIFGGFWYQLDTFCGRRSEGRGLGSSGGLVEEGLYLLPDL